MDQTRAEQALATWGANYRDRDVYVLRGLLAGLNKNRVHQLTGLSRTTIEAVLREYVDRATGEPVVDLAAVLRAKARALTGMTAPEFDHSLFVGDGRAAAAMATAAYLLANEDHPEVQPGDGERVLAERRQRGDALYEQALPQVEAMTARAKRRKYSAWSTAAQAAGQKIGYAD